MKDVYVIYGAMNSGKTHAMWLVLARMLEKGAVLQGDMYHAEKPLSYEYIISHQEWLPDFRALLDFKGRKIMLLSAGDYLYTSEWGVARHMRWAEENNVDYVVCCARSQNREGSVYRYLVDNYRGSVLLDDNWFWVSRGDGNSNWLVELDQIAIKIVEALWKEITAKKDDTISQLLDIWRALLNIKDLDLSHEDIVNASEILLKLLGNEEDESLLHKAGLTNMRFLDTALPIGGISGYNLNVSNGQVNNPPQLSLLYKKLQPSQPIELTPIHNQKDLIKQSIAIPYTQWYSVNKVLISSQLSLSRRELLQIVKKPKDNKLQQQYDSLIAESGVTVDNQIVAFERNPIDVSILEIIHEIIESLLIEGFTADINQIGLRRLINIHNNLFIQSLNINNFKLYDDKNDTINFKDGFTVLIGDNATGKTTVLDALSIALSTLLPKRIGNSRPIDYGLNNVFQLNSVHREIDKNGGVKYNWPAIITTDSIYSRLTRSRKNRNSRATRGINKNTKALFDTVSNSPESQERLPLIVYCGVERTRTLEKKKIEANLRYDRFDGYLNCFNTRSTTSFLKFWLRDLQQSATKNTMDKERLDSFVDAVCGCLKSEHIEGIKYIYSEQKLSDGKIDKVDDIVLTRRLSEAKTERELLSNMSSGYRVMVGLIADLAYRCIVLNPQLGKDAITGTSGIVLIDEIDMHLHPLWQRHIVEDLVRCFPKVQFITTTHSPFIVQSLKKEQVISLAGKEIDSDPTEANIDKSIRYMGIDSVYGKDFEDKVTLAQKFYNALRQKDIKRDELRRIYSEYVRRYGDDAVLLARLNLSETIAYEKMNNETH